MPAARQELLARLNALERVIPNDTVQNRAFHERAHNESARLLRNGLMVVGVAALEDFLKGRTQEVLRYVSASGLPFGALPPKLQHAATLGAVRSASGHLSKVWRSLGDDLMGNVQAVAVDVASTTGPTFALSAYSLGFENSNLTSHSVKEIGGAFGLNDPWRQIGRVAQRVGLSSPSHEEAFGQAMRNRHLAAHQAAARTEPTDLSAFVRHAKGIALGFDAIVSRAARLLVEDTSRFLRSDGLVDGGLRIRFFDEGADGYWRDIPESKATHRKAKTRSPLDAEALTRARRNQELWVVRDASKIPFEWYATDIA